MFKPEKPKEEDCCGSGCTPCIFDVYEQQLKKWEENKSGPENAPQVFDPLKYSPFRLIAVQKVTNDTSLYTFQAIDSNNQPLTHKISLKMGDYFILKSPNVSRPYTIIFNDILKQGMFQVLIKLYPNGKMSQFLTNVKMNDTLFWRGPYNNLKFKITDRILLVGAGTGVVPLHNIGLELVMNDDCDSLIKFILCFNCLEDVLLRDEFCELGSFWNCTVHYYLSRDTGMAPRYKEKIVFGRLTKDFLEKSLREFLNNVTVVICGPESFNDMCKQVCKRVDMSDERVIIL